MNGRCSVVSRGVLAPHRHLRQPFAQRRTPTTRLRAADDDPAPKKDADGKPSFGLDDLGPFQLGRKSRQAFDDLWTQFATLASPTSSFSETDIYQDLAFGVDPEASNTKVLVIGASGRIGRTVLRKLLLRGYQVRALVRDETSLGDVISTRVEMVVGDIRDPSLCQELVKGIDKIVFAAASRSLDLEESRSIFSDGLKNVLHAFMDYKWVKSPKRNGEMKKTVADFKRQSTIDAWNAQVLGRVSRFEGEEEQPIPNWSMVGDIRQWTHEENSFIVKQKDKNLQFRGAVNEIGSAAEIGVPVSHETISDSEGVVLRVRGDGNIYAFVCTLDDGQKYSARFVTKWGYSTARIPYTLFRPDWGGSEALDGSRIVSVGLRFENRGRPATTLDGSLSQRLGRFNLEVDWVKTLPAAKNTEFVLISCAGVPREGIDVETLREILMAQRLGEAMLRNSGIGYTIVRPTNLVDEPGGLKALVFDQGDRLSQSISAVDVADVGVRALPQPVASNKTFEVAHEGSSADGEESEDYELFAHVQDKSTNYLRAALANLQKNT